VAGPVSKQRQAVYLEARGLACKLNLIGQSFGLEPGIADAEARELLDVSELARGVL
jgi:hypothetical protein